MQTAAENIRFGSILEFSISYKFETATNFCSFFSQEMSPGSLTIKPLNLAAKFDCYSDSDEENNEWNFYKPMTSQQTLLP